MKKIIALLIALVMILALASCGESEESSSSTSTSSETSSSESGNTDEKIYVGHICDLTGVETMTGQEAQRAMDFAAKIINEDGGIDGREVEVITMDAQNSSSTAADVARQLVENNHVAAIFGPTQVGHKTAVGSYASEAKVPVIYYNGTPEEIVDENDYVIASGGSTNQMPTAMADYMYNELGFREINTIAQENTGGEDYMQPLIDKFEELGGTVVSSQWVPTDEGDTSAYLLNLPDADCLVGWLSGSQAINLWTQWYELGIYERMPMYGCTHGGFTDYFITDELASSRPEVVDAMLENTIVPVTYSMSLENKENDEFTERWKAEYGDTEQNTNLPGACFSAMLLFKYGVEGNGGSTEPESLLKAIQEVDLDTPEGHIYFTNSRIAVRDVYICKLTRLDDGGFSYDLLKTYDHVSPDGF
ncbi:MAG: ABC transporter substrate-binding protein [Oscillospiraceae bacterium]|nr:ABC transporter substrate-binding protein [Oscillospiraceae bacterium]